MDPPAGYLYQKHEHIFQHLNCIACVYTERGRSVNMLEWKQHKTLRNKGRIKTNKDDLSESTLQEWQSAGFC